MNQEKLLEMLNRTPISVDVDYLKEVIAVCEAEMNRYAEYVADEMKVNKFKVTKDYLTEGALIDYIDANVAGWNANLFKAWSEEGFEKRINFKFFEKYLTAPLSSFGDEVTLNYYYYYQAKKEMKRYQSILDQAVNGKIQPTFKINTNGMIYTAKPALQFSPEQLSKIFNSKFRILKLKEEVQPIPYLDGNGFSAKEKKQIIEREASIRTRRLKEQCIQEVKLSEEEVKQGKVLLDKVAQGVGNSLNIGFSIITVIGTTIYYLTGKEAEEKARKEQEIKKMADSFDFIPQNSWVGLEKEKTVEAKPVEIKEYKVAKPIEYKTDALKNKFMNGSINQNNVLTAQEKQAQRIAKTMEVFANLNKKSKEKEMA